LKREVAELWSRVVKNTVFGVLEGVVYYIIYFKLLPMVFSSALGVPIEPPPLLTMLILGVFIALGVISASVKPFVGVVFEAISSILGALLLLSILGKTFTYSAEFNGVSVEMSMEIRSIVLVIIGFSVLYTIIRCFSRLSSLAEE
jgi:hypothetical protein